MYKQRDIVLLPYPYSDLTTTKVRPALIISNNKVNTGEDRICLQLTSAKPKGGIEVNDLEQGTLPLKSWLRPQKVFTFNSKLIRKKLGVITKEFHNKAVEELNNYLE